MKATANQTNTFLYDAWNMVQESTVSGLQSHVSHFVWGLDLSGTLQGAGGVSGLLMVVKGRANPPGEPHFPSCDANGNVTDLVDTNGTVVAHYEYDPYGNTIAQSGPQADANPFRFSTKYWDGETGLYYYGYRFYSPSLGRLLNRDPIEEEGGLNLFMFAENDPVDFVDPFGLECQEKVDGNLSFSFSNFNNQPGDCRLKIRLNPGGRWGIGLIECDNKASIDVSITGTCEKTDKCCKTTTWSISITASLSKDLKVGVGVTLRPFKWQHRLRAGWNALGGLAKLQAAMEAYAKAQYAVDKVCAATP